MLSLGAMTQHASVAQDFNLNWLAPTAIACRLPQIQVARRTATKAVLLTPSTKIRVGMLGGTCKKLHYATSQPDPGVTLPINPRRFTPARLLAASLGLPVVAFILLLSPFVTVRIGRLRSERIGHYLGNTEIALSKIESEVTFGGKRSIDLWFNVPPISNSQVALMLERVINVWPRRILQPTYFALRGLNIHRHLIEYEAEDRDIGDYLAGGTPHLKFTKSETQHCADVLREVTGEADPRWVCLHQRDSSYLSQTFPDEDWSYHNHRDTPIERYVPAAETLATLGYWVFRMGKIVESPLETENSRVIDYAMSPWKSDLMDVFLGAHCKFFMSSSSGIDALATVFRRPLLFVNFPAPFHAQVWKKDHLFIFQHYSDAKTHEPLSLREIYRRVGDREPRPSVLDQASITLTSNTDVEITSAALEMHEFSSHGRMQVNAYDLHLQERFWALYPRISSLHGSAPFRASVGSAFLRENQHLLRTA